MTSYQPLTDAHTVEADDVARQLGVEIQSGLGDTEAHARLQQCGPNALMEKSVAGPWTIFFAQFKSLIIWVLIGAALVSGLLREWVDAVAIVVIVVLNAVLGFVQEYRAEKALAALKRMASPQAKALRNGRRVMLPTQELVPGDVVEIEAGDHVPADARLVSLSANFTVQEASLTGESVPSPKSSARLDTADVPLGDRVNMVYMGTSVASGKALAVVTQTGMGTELGKIAGMIQAIEPHETPLQRKLAQFGVWIVYVCFALVALVFSLEWWRGGKLLDVFMTAVSLAVAAIPEGMPAVVTIALALGVQRMVKRHALIRKLPSVETLGCATVICTDKTGTLTRNEMTVQAVFAGGRLYRVTGAGYEPKGSFLSGGTTVNPQDEPDLRAALECGALCNAAQLEERDGAWTILGDPTEGALLTAAAKAGISLESLGRSAPLVAEIPFDSVRKKMAMVRDRGGERVAYVKGAPDIMLAECTHVLARGVVQPLADEGRAAILAANTELARQALRVLAVGCRTLDASATSLNPAEVETHLVFAGLVAMIDPPRDEARTAVAQCKQAGIATVMITGDHRDTAVAIARDLGFFASDSIALTGAELDRLTDEALARQVRHTAVYARVTPEHKHRIVRAWRTRGDIVAMTGDGVNDAPAVKEADIGVAMGITGTDVTKEVADMIVTDDNFASIVSAVEEGRGIYNNIRKFVHYLLSCNTGEILLMLGASLAGLPAPLLPIHIRWVNLVTDGLPALALGVDPPDQRIMRRPPRDPAEPVVTPRRMLLMLMQGVLIAGCSLAAFVIVRAGAPENLVRARTAAFIVISCSQLFHAFNCRSQVVSLFTLGVCSNMKLVAAVLVSFALQMSVVWIPFLQPIFKSQIPSGTELLLLLFLSSLPLWLMEAAKLARRFRSRSDD